MKRIVPVILVGTLGYWAALASTPSTAAVAQESQATNTFPTSRIPIAPDQGDSIHFALDEMKKVAAVLKARGEKGQSTVDPVDLMQLPLTRTHLFSFAYVPHSDHPAMVAQHEGVTDINFITTGSGTLIVGGEIENRQAGSLRGEYTGTTIRGGKSFRVTAGDILTIPANLPSAVIPDMGGLSRLAVKINTGIYPWSLINNPGYNDEFVARHPEVARRFQQHLSVDDSQPTLWSMEQMQRAEAALKVREAFSQIEMPYHPWTPTYFMSYARRPYLKTPARPEQHEGVTDIYLIPTGSGTIIVGGEIEKRTSNQPGEYGGGPIRGGKKYRVKAGDIIAIPPNQPHATEPDAGGLSRVMLKVNVGLYPWNLVAGAAR